MPGLLPLIAELDMQFALLGMHCYDSAINQFCTLDLESDGQKCNMLI